MRNLRILLSSVLLAVCISSFTVFAAPVPPPVLPGNPTFVVTPAIPHTRIQMSIVNRGTVGGRALAPGEFITIHSNGALLASTNVVNPNVLQIQSHVVWIQGSPWTEYFILMNYSQYKKYDVRLSNANGSIVLSYLINSLPRSTLDASVLNQAGQIGICVKSGGNCRSVFQNGEELDIYRQGVLVATTNQNLIMAGAPQLVAQGVVVQGVVGVNYMFQIPELAETTRYDIVLYDFPGHIDVKTFAIVQI